jgi:hypothetical protein
MSPQKVNNKSIRFLNLDLLFPRAASWFAVIGNITAIADEPRSQSHSRVANAIPQLRCAYRIGKASLFPGWLAVLRSLDRRTEHCPRFRAHRNAVIHEQLEFLQRRMLFRTVSDVGENDGFPLSKIVQGNGQKPRQGTEPERLELPRAKSWAPSAAGGFKQLLQSEPPGTPAVRRRLGPNPAIESSGPH